MSRFADLYASYLVRFWRGNAENESEPAEYRVEVEHIQSGERSEFADLSDLLNYLQSSTLTPPGVAGSDARATAGEKPDEKQGSDASI